MSSKKLDNECLGVQICILFIYLIAPLSYETIAFSLINLCFNTAFISNQFERRNFFWDLNMKVIDKNIHMSVYDKQWFWISYG